MWLVVLLANDGRCVYCAEPSETMDHVIAWGCRGEDSLRNLVPACETCNQSKGAKAVLGWYLERKLRERLTKTGTTRPESGLREHYEWAHKETLALLDRLEAVAEEIMDEGRRRWFDNKTWAVDIWARVERQSVSELASLCRAGYAAEAVKAEASGWQVK
ncbi:HNH endonuclease [Streptomyces sp. NPDC001118]